MDDGLPSQICSTCLLALHTTYEFKVLCEHSDQTFRKLLTGSSAIKIAETADALDEVLEIKIEPELDVNCNIPDTQEISDELNGTKETPSPPNLRTRRTYVRRQPLKALSCKLCQVSFSKRKTWVLHNEKEHGIKTSAVRKTYLCQICQTTFVKWADLINHEKETRHYGREKCKYCQKMLSRSYIKNHLRKHTGEKIFLCNLCGTSFAWQASFQKHTKVCSKTEKKLQCAYCDLKFREAYHLLTHTRTHTNERPFVCETCGKTFARTDKLLQHQLIHSNLKPYQCSTCSRYFRQASHLTEHYRVHTKEKPYTCDLCDAAFTQGHALKSHKQRHPIVKA